MRKDLILSLFVLLGAAGVVFGAGMLVVAYVMDGKTPSAAVPAAESAASDKSGIHVRPDAASHGASLAPASPEVMAEVEPKYNDFLTRKRFDDCREQAIKALSLTGPDNAAWQLRLANATFLADTLPQQKRFAMAHEAYAHALALGLEPSSREVAQYRVCQCLRLLGRWEELEQASSAYLKEFKSTPHSPETTLLHAEALSATGKSADALVELGTLTDADMPENIRAQALWQSAQLTLRDSQNQIAETVALASDAASSKENARHPLIVTTGLAKPVLSGPGEVPDATAAKKVKPEAVDLAGIPESQWNAIQRCLERSNFEDAKRQLAPYLAASSGELHTRISMRYAKLMLQVANASNKREQNP